MTINEKIKALQEQLVINNLSAYLIPSSDPHQSEYCAKRWKSREWISGFTGSTGMVIVTPDHAGLWTDSRYFLQAEQQLANSEFVLHKLRIPHTPQHIEWLEENIPAGSQIGCDGSVFSIWQVEALEEALQDKNISINHQLDLFDLIWTNRPPAPTSSAFFLENSFAGQPRADKLSRLRESMQQHGATDHLLANLADIAWLLNIRSNDIDFSPVLVAYLHINLEEAFLFVEQSKISEEMEATFRANGVTLQPYEAIRDFLVQLDQNHKVLIDPSSTNIKNFQYLEKAQTILAPNPSLLMRSIKNEVEIAHIKEAMVKDGIALTRLNRWLEKTLEQNQPSEVEVAQQLDHFRREQGDYQGESFPAIVGYASNGAIVHYRPVPEQCAQVQAKGLLLLDSGGQYLQGTTDITRTTALSPPSAEQKKNFTLVLKGHINIARLKFPHGTTGYQMDALARQYLWEQGLDYGHGTGHGVGYFLNVHEGPHSISKAKNRKTMTPLEAGMLTSNEPGYYQTGDYGIRIENLILCVEDQSTSHGRFLKFETLSLFPIDLSLIDFSLLTATEKDWLEAYHQQVYQQLAPNLSKEEQVWLQKQCGLS